MRSFIKFIQSLLFFGLLLLLFSTSFLLIPTQAHFILLENWKLWLFDLNWNWGENDRYLVGKCSGNCGIVYFLLWFNLGALVLTLFLLVCFFLCNSLHSIENIVTLKSFPAYFLRLYIYYFWIYNLNGFKFDFVKKFSNWMAFIWFCYWNIGIYKILLIQ